MPNIFMVLRCVQVVYLSKNLLRSLDGIQQFHALRVLSLADNLLSDFDALAPLQVRLTQEP